MLVIAFLSRSKRLLISWIQWPSEVISEPPKVKKLEKNKYVCISYVCDMYDITYVESKKYNKLVKTTEKKQIHRLKKKKKLK